MWNKKVLPTVIFFLQIILIYILSLFPESIERFYSNGIYVSISNTLRTLLGSIPFSVGDIIYFFVIGLLIRWFWKKRGSWKLNWKGNAVVMLNFISGFYFLFHVLWGINYHRVKLFDKMAIGTEYSDADLLRFTKQMILKTNEIQLKITSDRNSRVLFPYSQDQVFAMNLNGYDNLAKQYPFFKYSNLSVKKSLISTPLSYMGFAGYLNPFTNEAQVNDKVLMYNFPTTTTHEMAHQLGYASESEANFIGYLASIKNDNLYFQYSGYSMALRYCLRNWKIRDENILKKLVPTINPGILKNYKDSEEFWDQYETFIETGFKIFYDNFLKLNQQKDGLESYSKFVDLMVNYYKVNPL